MRIGARRLNRRATGWTTLVAGLGVSVAAVVLGVHSVRPPAAVGALPVAEPSPSVEHPSSAGRLLAESPAPGGVPTRLTIAALHVDASVQAVGVGEDRALEVPADPADVGWWIGSAVPGSPRGTVLIVGHVDTASDGPGALFKLETLRMGTPIRLEAGHQAVTYRAVARRSYSKQHLPKQLFSSATPAELALVTCGGTFRHGTYRDNVVVYAEPLS
jgi:hypothetical protein